jgi:hypothetical protein
MQVQQKNFSNNPDNSFDRLNGDFQEFLIDEKILMKFSVWFSLILLIAGIALFSIFYGFAELKGTVKFLIHLILWIIPIIFLHEGLHGIVWAIANRNIKNIKFGFYKEYLTFYTHCKVPLSKWKYFAGGIAPFIFLSILPLLLSLIYGSSYWLGFGIFNGWTCTADLLVCYYVFLQPSYALIQDHPDKLGFMISKPA